VGALPAAALPIEKESIMRFLARSLVRAIVPLALLSLAVPVSADRPAPTPGVPSGEKGTRFGVVAVSHPLAANAGALMLEAGGNAIDAAAAIQFALNVVEPQYSGVGGGGFMMIHLARTGETFVVDGREEAPAAADPDMFGTLTFTEASTSGISVGVPGTLAALSTALARWGTMSLREVTAPAIELAEHGFAINGELAAQIVDTSRGVVMTALQPETAAIFQPGGVPLKTGDVLVQPDLAKTLQLIARHGPGVFYEGEIAGAIVKAQQRTRVPAGSHAVDGVGRMTRADLAAYRPRLRTPIVDEYRGWTIASMSPPSSGGLTIIQMLKMMERFPMGDATQGFGFGAKNTLHVMIEAMRLAFADRAFWMGDADFVHVPKVGLLADPYVASRSALIQLGTVMPSVAPGNPLPFDEPPASDACHLGPPTEQQEGVHTTHLAVVDREGNIVTWTTTIESAFGTGITVPGYGFLLNNELTDFNFPPTRNAVTCNPGANDVAPGKRPRSSMSPTILLKDGKPFAAYGSPGGSTIINTVLQITMNLLDHGMTIQEAIDAPRISSGLSGVVSCEVGPLFPLGFTPTPAFSTDVLAALIAMGHKVPAACSHGNIGSVQGVVIDLQTGKQYGGADHRREGTVIPIRNAGNGH
jgi:gamma-glutamyltranspeptidase/glutathione hydrolase